MSAAAAISGAVYSGRRNTCWLGTPEIYFRKSIDNSRLVKVEDPRRAREMKQFGIALCLLFALVMGYALQHFRAIEFGYQIETLRNQRDGLLEMNRALRLEEASLRDPERIDVMARKLGLQSPQPGQVMHLDVDADTSAPVMASVTPISVVSARAGPPIWSPTSSGHKTPWRARASTWAATYGCSVAHPRTHRRGQSGSSSRMTRTT